MSGPPAPRSDAALRRVMWARLRAGDHWIVALTERERDLTETLLLTLEARRPRAATTLHVDCWDLHLSVYSVTLTPGPHSQNSTATTAAPSHPPFDPESGPGWGAIERR